MRSLTLNRRNFLLATAAAAGATWFDVPRILADTREASAKKYGGFVMGIQSYSLRGFKVDDAIEKIGELELHDVEFFGGHFSEKSNDEQIAAMKAKLDKGAIMMSSHGVNGFGPDHEKNRAVFAFAKKCGMRNLSANPQKNDATFESLDKCVKEFDIRIAIHNHGPGALYDKPEDSINAVAKWDKRIGYCADLGHYIRSGVKPEVVIPQLADRLYGIHLKDFKEMKRNTQGCILGDGHMDVEATFRALKDAKFPADGALSLEYEENPKDPMAEIKQCYDVAAKAAQKVAAG
ncbi:MAG: TIM barrel protein [Phycisphaera sp.]|nr:TIM barrel protein [Phycisphaera sp.]